MWTFPRVRVIFGILVILAVGYFFIREHAVPEFCDTFREVRIADTREGILALLGEPEVQERSQVPNGPYWGPTEGLLSILGHGAPYEQWKWFDESNTYYVWFSSKSQRPPEQWLVVAKGHHPTGAVF